MIKLFSVVNVFVHILALGTNLYLNRVQKKEPISWMIRFPLGLALWLSYSEQIIRGTQVTQGEFVWLLCTVLLISVLSFLNSYLCGINYDLLFLLYFGMIGIVFNVSLLWDTNSPQHVLLLATYLAGFLASGLLFRKRCFGQQQKE